MEHDNLRQILAANIRALRSSSGLSQEELASQVGVHRTYLGAVERGERNITLLTLERIAEALKVHPVSLLINSENDRPR